MPIDGTYNLPSIGCTMNHRGGNDISVEGRLLSKLVRRKHEDHPERVFERNPECLPVCNGHPFLRSRPVSEDDARDVDRVICLRDFSLYGKDARFATSITLSPIRPMVRLFSS
jgi:hypothetical protein